MHGDRHRPAFGHRVWARIEGDLYGPALPKVRYGRAGFVEGPRCVGWPVHSSCVLGAGLAHGIAGSGIGIALVRIREAEQGRLAVPRHIGILALIIVRHNRAPVCGRRRIRIGRCGTLRVKHLLVYIAIRVGLHRSGTLRTAGIVHAVCIPVVGKPHDVAHFMDKTASVGGGNAKGGGGEGRRQRPHPERLPTALRTEEHDDVRPDAVTDGMDVVHIAVRRFPETIKVYILPGLICRGRRLDVSLHLLHGHQLNGLIHIAVRVGQVGLRDQGFDRGLGLLLGGPAFGGFGGGRVEDGDINHRRVGRRLRVYAPPKQKG